MAQILIVDDDKRLTDMLRRTLIHKGWSVAVANSGTEALPLLTASEAELAILDV